MKVAHYLRGIARETRGSRGRLFFFTLCLALGVAAVTGVAALTNTVEQGLSAQSRELLGADLSITANAPLPPGLDAALALPHTSARVEARELATLLRAGEQSRLVELKAVGLPYPLYGAVQLQPAAELAALLNRETCVLAHDLAQELGLELGDPVFVGGAQFRVAAWVLSEPGRLDISFTLGPRVFLSLDGLARTELEQFGSRMRYRALYRLPEDQSEEQMRELRERVSNALPEAAYLRIESHRQSGRTVRRALERVERYLGLVALLSLMLGGIGVAQIVRAWIATRTTSIAVLRALGMRPREVLAFYLGHVALLALCGSAIGALFGSLAPLLLAAAAPDLLPSGVQLSWEGQSLLRGTALGMGVALLFCLLPLTAIWRVTPLRALRSEHEQLAAPAALRYGLLATFVAGIFLAAWSQSKDPALATYFTAGLGLAAFVLWLAARGLMAAARHCPRDRGHPYLRNSVAALARPGSGVAAAMLALGLGVLVVSALGWIAAHLQRRLRTALPSDAPSVFLLDVQPDQWPGIEALLGELEAQALQCVPVLTARLSAIDGISVAELSRSQNEANSGRTRWVLTREQRLTWRAQLPSDNQIVAGELWQDPAVNEVSVEQDFAEDLGIGLGARLTFDVQGVPIDLRVTSLRSVEWESFGVNFFLVVEPGVLAEAPHFLLAAARLDGANETRLQDRLSKEYPNVTPIRVRAILEKVLAVLTRLALCVRALGAFSVLTGSAILAGVASASAVRRSREVALWKTLGLTRLDVVRLLGAEYALIGLCAGGIGAAAAYILSRLLLMHWFDLSAEIGLWSPLANTLATGLLAALAGLAASARALRARPLAALRAQE